MGAFVEALKFWKWPILGVLGIAGLVHVFVLSVMAESIWMLLPIFGIPSLGTLIAFGIYNNCAEIYLRSQKSGPNSGHGYRGELRRLKKVRKEAVRKMWSMKGSGYNSAYYLDVIETEKKIAEHMGIDYVKPDYVPKSRY